MNYLRLDIRLEEEFKEILMAELAELGFEAFEDGEPKLLSAYVQEDLYQQTETAALLERYKGHLIEVKGPIAVEQQNWNAVWESQYEPVAIDDFCLIRAPFHPKQSGFVHVITIEPKMSFGTGHHTTTTLVVRAMRHLPLVGMRVLDMGCGTGILGILAAKLGAKSVDGIDIDNWAVENSAENCTRNQVHMELILGTAQKIEKVYDVILANINRNIILDDLAVYAKHLEKGGKLICSGFYMHDVDIIRERAALNNLILTSQADENGWSAVIFEKK
jgi:ribosomal protein L11 methyltransferase